MLRLAGLPAPSRCPRVTVTLTEAAVILNFVGPEHAQLYDVPRRLVGIDDEEGFELRLLADLQARGYEVARAPGPADDA